MHNRGHLGVSLLLYAPVLLILLLHNLYTTSIIGLLLTISLYSLPDYDLKLQNRTTIAHKSKLLNHLLPQIKHRGVTHTIWFAGGLSCLLTIIGYIIYPYTHPIIQLQVSYFIISIFSLTTLVILTHIIGDTLTPRGTQPLYPLSTFRISFPISLAANTYTNQFFIIFGYLSILFAVITRFMIELQITRNTLLVYTYFTYYVSLILVVGVYIAGKPLFDMLYNKLRFRYQKVKYYIQSLS